MTTQIQLKYFGIDGLLQQLTSIYFVMTNILNSAVQANFFDRERASQNNPLQMSTHQQLIHTFETTEQCSTNCPRPCVMQILEELEMMPRWICDPSLASQNNAQLASAVPKGATPNSRSLRPLLNNDNGDALSALSQNQYVLLIAPVVCLLILCVAISLRRCSASSSMAII